MNRLVGLLLGLVIIFIGFSIIFTGFGIILVILKLILGLAIVYLGIKAITGGFGEKKNEKGGKDVIFAESIIKEEGSGNRHYNVIFGKGTIDLSDKIATDATIEVRINVVFGAAIIKLKKEHNFRITSNTVFGSAKMPDENTTAFGTLTYNSSASEGHFLDIKLDVVFGNVSFEII